MPRRRKPAGVVDPDREISAQVILPAARGPRSRLSVPATVETLAEFLPDPDLVRKARDVLRARGFRVGPTVGNNFAVTASARAFERVLGVSLRVNADGSIQCVAEDGSKTYECPRKQLPAEIARFVETITFTRPPDFGPTRFDSR